MSETIAVNILAFGIAKDIMGGSLAAIDVKRPATVKTLKSTLEQQYPRLGKIASYLVAINNEYAANDTVISEQDEIAIIPPVSGG